jgi:hypothetical protein
MWQRTTLAYTLTLTIFSIAGVAYFKNRDKVSRTPSSISVKKLWIPGHNEKHLAPVKVQIAEIENIPASVNEPVTLNGKISINHPIDETLSYSWSLPDGVKLIRGVMSEEIDKLQMGQVIDVSITVTGFSKESQKIITLSAGSYQKGEKIGNSTVIPSRPEDTFEYIAPEIKRVADEQLAESTSTFSR